MPRDANDTTPEMPAVGGDDDDEATRIDPKPPAAVPVRAKFASKEDDEATTATGTPKKVREVQKLLEESRRMNAAGPKKPVKKLHPLIPIGVAFAILAVLLLVVNWLVRPSVGADGQPEESSGVRKLFDW